MVRRLNKMEKECMNRLNEVIETGDYISGLIQDVATGRTTFVDKRLTDINAVQNNLKIATCYSSYQVDRVFIFGYSSSGCPYC